MTVSVCYHSFVCLHSLNSQNIWVWNRIKDILCHLYQHFAVWTCFITLLLRFSLVHASFFQHQMLTLLKIHMHIASIYKRLHVNRVSLSLFSNVCISLAFFLSLVLFSTKRHFPSPCCRSPRFSNHRSAVPVILTIPGVTRYGVTIPGYTVIESLVSFAWLIAHW